MALLDLSDHLPDPLGLARRNLDLARRARRLSPDQITETLSSGASPDLPLLAKALFPHLCSAPMSPMHWYMLTQWSAPLLHLPPGDGIPRRRLAMAAPRGHAKSTLASLILPLLALGFRRQPYILLLSATVRQAAARLRNIRSELEQNRGLQLAFPHLTQRGRPWSNRSLLVGESLVESYGALSEIRGLNHRGHRPSLIILDDTDATHRVRNPLQRSALLAWYDEVVEPLGDRDTIILVVGTVLHHDSLLSQLLRRPTWQGTLWRALVQPPTHSHLWTQWMNLLTTPGDGDGSRLSEEFHQANRQAMKTGARALWPQRDSVLELYHMMAVQGLSAFRKEKQNDPLPPEQGPWSPSRWLRFVLRRDELMILPPSHSGESPDQSTPPPSPVRLENLATYGYLDPATGRAAAQGRRGGDYAALVTVGRESGADPRYFLLEVWMARCPMEQQVAAVAQAALRWGWNAFAFESNGFQSILGPHLTRALRDAALPAGLTPLVPISITHTQPKDLRIERAGLLVNSGRLLFQAHLPQEFQQNAEDYPHPGAHDDGLDALAGAIELARSRNAAAQVTHPIRTVRRTARIR